MNGDLIEVGLPDAAATEALGAALAQWLGDRCGAVIYLHGELGAGKTTLARGLLHGLGVTGAVRSPTYTLVEPYELSGRRVLHMDLYRLQDAEELMSLGVHDDSPRDSVWLVEWPERGGELLPLPTLVVDLARCGEGRRAALRLPGSAADKLPDLRNALNRQGLEAQLPAES